MEANNIFWNLPYNLRRYLFKTFRREEFDKFDKLFTTPNADGVSWKKMKELKFIFVHIPKTGGLSLASILQGCTINKHLTAKRFQLFLSEKEFNEYFKFAIVRNPWDRLVSAYLYLKKGGITQSDHKFCSEVLVRFETFDSFVKNYLLKRDNLDKLYIHFIPQYKYICDHREELLVDYVGKFENYPESCKYILDKLGVSDIEIKKENVNKTRVHYREYYDEETKEIVANIYKKDIELLRYNF